MKTVVEALYIGNGNESFCEDKFTDGINVVFSDDNNVGKTIVMQGIMFALGSQPAFPESFPYREYVFIVDITVDGRKKSIMRNRNTFAIADDAGVFSFDSVDSFQEYWSSKIQELPALVKNNHTVTAGFEL